MKTSHLLGCLGMIFSLVPAKADPGTIRIASGFSQPLFLTAPTSDTSRVFVAEKGGAIKIFNPLTGAVNATPFLTTTGINTAGEGGLLGLAFHPDYATNGKLYVDLINTAGDTEIREYTVSANPNIANSASGRVILTIDQPAGRTNHKAGWLAFGPNDGDLYIATGDGGSGNDPDNFAQNPNSLLGKILRIDVNTTTIGPTYAIPSANPFALSGGAPEVWALGLRNPYRNGFDRDTGDLFIADVGQNAREEVNFQAAASAGGKNYGWRPREGTIDNSGVGDAAPPGAIDPIYDYPRGSGVFMGETVVGGYVYRGSLAPQLEGKYFFADYIDSKVWSFNYDGTVRTELTSWTSAFQPEAGSFSNFSAFGEDANGELYLVSINGDIFQVVPEPGTLALMGLGLGTLGYSASRRRVNRVSSGRPTRS